MKVSLNALKKLIGFELPPVEELVKRVNSQLGQVEGVIDVNDKYKDVVIVKVVTAEKHPNADKLTVCMIDDGGVVENVARNESGLVQVVCGAPNVKSGMWAAWLPPGSTVPASYDDPEPFVLDARELRGVTSYGMLAASDELGIGSDHTGIVDISDEDLKSNETELRPGASFAKVFGLDDTVIELENKMFTHRPDCFGQLGVAREIFAILQTLPDADKTSEVRFENPDWYWNMPEFGDASGLELNVFNEAPEKVERFMAVAIKDVEVKQSPLWLRCELTILGSKPINNVVDITNYIMLLTGQPTHAYDYDKLDNQTLGVRMAQKGEKATLLNGKSYELNEEDMVIVDSKGVIGLGGVMGGLESEVTFETKNVVLEVATFDMYNIRKTSMRYGLFTDAVTRFNKGQSPLQNSRVMKKMLAMMPGEQASPVYDLPENSENRTKDSVHPAVQITPEFINSRLGADLTEKQIGGLLRFVWFASYPSEQDDSAMEITAPFWRTDIDAPEDIVEEVGRLYGFDKLPVELPRRSTKPAPKNPDRELKRKIRDSLRRAGGSEVLTYSFVHENTIKKAEQDAGQAFQISNALSPDLQYYRLSVLPSLLDKVHMNIKAGHDEFILFELGKGHNKKHHLNGDEGLPYELQFVDGVYASKKSLGGAAYYHVRRLVQQLGLDLGFSVIFKPLDEKQDYLVAAPFDLKRSAVVETADGKFIGIIGELKTTVKRNFKLPAYTAAMTLDFDGLKNAVASEKQTYSPLSRYPSTSQDISLKTRAEIPYKQISDTVYQAAVEAAGETSVKVEPVSIYQPKDTDVNKTTTFHLTFSDPERTLRDEDVNSVMDAVAEEALGRLGAERI